MNARLELENGRAFGRPNGIRRIGFSNRRLAAESLENRARIAWLTNHLPGESLANLIQQNSRTYRLERVRLLFTLPLHNAT